MIIVRAPLRISFVGGGTDLPNFYQLHPGKVISATINKYVYVAINPAPLLQEITARYSEIENVKFVKDLKNNRIREAMTLLEINDYMEIGTFSHLKVGTGLGASSSFTVSLIKGLSAYKGKRFDRKELAELACKVEIDLIKEPIGKQDQYAAAFGGFNVFNFNSDGTVEIEPILLDFKKRVDLENHMLVFFSGMTRKASDILKEQKNNIAGNFESLKSLTKMVDLFKTKLVKGDFKALGELLHEGWLKKKKLASKVSNDDIDKLYATAIRNGAWGGKLLGAGGGGCLLFLAPPKKKEVIKTALNKMAQKNSLSNFQEVPITFVHSGVEVVSNSLIS